MCNTNDDDGNNNVKFICQIISRKTNTNSAL